MTERDTIRVLLVEDDRDDYELTRDLLADISIPGKSFAVDWITSYDDALTMLNREAHDLCLLDYYLGARDGLELLTEAVSTATRVPIIFLTGRGDREVEHQAIAFGAADYLVKGEIDARVLERSIRHSLERGRSLEALRDRERQFRSVFEATLDAMLIVENGGRCIDGNDAALSLLGVSRAELSTLTMADIVVTEGADRAETWPAMLIEHRIHSEVHVVRADGAVRLVEFRLAPEFRPGRHLAVLRDVTERRVAEAHQRRLAAIVESAADAIDGITLDGIIDYWSPSAERLYGYSAQQAIGNSKAILFPESRAGEFEDLLSRVRRGEALRVAETVRRRSDGKVFEASVTVSPVLQDGRLVGASVITRDISEKKQLEAHLAVSDRMASVGTLAAGVAHEINNPLAALIANLEFLAEALAVPEDARGSRGGETASAKTGAGPQAGPILHTVALYDSGGALTAAIAEFLASGISAGAPSLVIATEAHRALLLARLRSRGVDVEDLCSRGELISIDARETLASFMVGGMPDGDLFRASVGPLLERFTSRAAPLRAYGEMVDLLVADGHREAAVRLEQMWNELLRAHDFTLLCAYDAQHFRTPEQIRQVCASHTHVLLAVEPQSAETRDWSAWDLRHTRELTAEIARRKLIESSVAPGDRVSRLPSADVRSGDELHWSATAERLNALREPLADARSAAHRIRHVVGDLKLFSKPQEERRGPVDLRRVIDSALRIAWNETRHRARIVKLYGEVRPVNGNDARLSQVFLNLLVNAAHAIEPGDAERNEITIATRMDDAGDVVVEVRDTGAGIAPDALPRIFEPFFTTKPAGIGTGLGLSICRRTVQELGGAISVESVVGRGTTFAVTLPASRIATSAPQPPRHVSSRPPRRGHVLIIDDDPMIVKAVRRSLTCDHEITSANSGAQALKLLREEASYDVIICDMMMPQMTGVDFYRALLELMPSRAAQVVFLTGGAFTPECQAFLEDIPNARVHKPFDPVHLRTLVNERIT